MKKSKCLLCILLLLLCSCSKQENDELKKEIDSSIKQALNAELCETSENNCVKDYYTYNASLNIGRLNSDEISNQFMIEGNHSALSLDISSILLNQISSSQETYELRDVGTLANLVYSYSGTYVNSSGEMIPFTVKIATTDQENYFALIQSSQFIFISSIADGTLENTIYDMLVLLRTCTVNSTKVILNYAGKSVISYSANEITLFGDDNGTTTSVDEETASFIRIGGEEDATGQGGETDE